VLGYLRILFNPDDTIGLQRIINVPKRGVGAKTVEKFTLLATEQRKSLLKYLLDTQKSTPDELPKSLQDFARIVSKLIDLSSKQAVSELIEDVIEFTGYKAELQQTSEGESRLENIQELKSLAKKFDQLDYTTGLEKFLEEIALIESSYEATKDEEEHITLMTVHAAKGLEFEYVFIAGMEENLFPHANSKYDPQELAEERRLAYVAVTRAKKQVYMSHAESRMYFGSRNSNPVSRFIDDIPEQLLIYCNTFVEKKKDSFSGWSDVDEADEFKPTTDINKGDLVKHEIFGVGEVVDIDDFIVLIRFSAGLKELALEYVRLEKI
jgi:DNA helicase-2/ATP-dependent DNA helicase PcrA